MKLRLPIAAVVCFLSLQCGGKEITHFQERAPWSRRIADSFVLRHPGAVTYDSTSPSEKWNYEQGLMLVALERMWRHSDDRRYFRFVRDNLAHYIDEDGSVRTYAMSDFNLDNCGPGRALIAVYQETEEQKYKSAADTLWQQLEQQPRTKEGGYWHKKIYPYQMWLDGLFMAGPFRARYAQAFNEPSAYEDIVNQFLWIARHTRNAKTGLFYHAWDESKAQKWADSTTGCSPNFWGRAMGWFAMALVDVLDYVPEHHPGRPQLIALLGNFAPSIMHVRDPKSMTWYQVVDQGDRKGNYLEASASCMFVYALAKGVRKGYLPEKYLAMARESFKGILAQFVTVDEQGFVDLHETCRGAGLGGTPYRDGSFEYYISEPRRTNDMKGIGPFLLAAIELEEAASVH